MQGQGQGHEPFKVGNLVIFKSYLLRHLQWELATDHGFLIFVLVSVSRDFFNLAETSVPKSRLSVPYGANLFLVLFLLVLLM